MSQLTGLAVDCSRPSGEPSVVGIDGASLGSDTVPSSVTNFQARAVMRQTIMADGRSLFRAVNEDLTAARDAVKDKPDSDPAKIKAEIAWQAWEQANDYLRRGPLVMSLASTYGFTDAVTDELFRQAEQVIA